MRMLGFKCSQVVLAYARVISFCSECLMPVAVKELRDERSKWGILESSGVTVDGLL